MKVIIIGAGASGVTSAIKLKQIDKSIDVTILEHLEQPLKKIYATGNGRCNIANKNSKYYSDVKEFLDSIGLKLREDGMGRMYPYSNQASSVVDTMLTACNKLKIKIEYGINIKRIDYYENKYHIFTSQGILESDAVILATGGKSQSALGSDGSGYQLAKNLGHSVTELSPALVQLKSSSKYCRQLKGVRVKCDVAIETNGEIVAKDCGELLFADYGISGIVVMNLSNFINDTKLKNGLDKTLAVIDFVPEMSIESLNEHYEKFGDFKGILPQKLCAILEKQSNGNPELMSKYIKSWRLIITGTKGFDYAQITKGGIPNDELDEMNQSKLCKGLYIVGELTNNQFECGGYNLSYALYSGINAAKDIANNQ